MRKLLMLLTLLALCAAMAFAADVTGSWKGSFETPMGTMENTFVLKADGSTVTGTIQGGPGGELKIDDGKIEGDKISFSATMEFGTIKYSGTVTGDEMKLEMSFGGGGGRGEGMPPMQITAKRVK